MLRSTFLSLISLPASQRPARAPIAGNSTKPLLVLDKTAPDEVTGHFDNYTSVHRHAWGLPRAGLLLGRESCRHLGGDMSFGRRFIDAETGEHSVAVLEL